MKITDVNVDSSQLSVTLLMYLRGRVFHVTRLSVFEKIRGKRLVNGLAPQSQKCLGIRLEVQRPVVSRYAVAILQADLMDA
jgi:hypothetical protein